MGFQYAYFANYALAAFFINYVALPYFYRSRKFWFLLLVIIASLTASVFIEELFLERIFFPRRLDSVMAISAFLDLIPIVTMISGGKFAWDAITKQKEVEQLKDAVRQSELQFLRSQINPHFLFNNLNNLYSYALEGSEKTPEIILELSGLLRYMLYECKDDYVSLEKEVTQLENFIGLNTLQVEDRGRVRFDKKGDFNRYQIAPLILVVFVENAFKHSFSSLSHGIDIRINLSVDEAGNLKFTCQNRFLAVKQIEQVAHGIGLENVSKRLELLYPGRHQLATRIKADEFHVDLEIKLRK